MHTTTIRKWGNSYAIRLPKESVKKFMLTEGQAVRLEDAANGRAISIVPATRRSASLSQLLGGITPLNRHSLADWGRPRGKEAW